MALNNRSLTISVFPQARRFPAISLNIPGIFQQPIVVLPTEPILCGFHHIVKQATIRQFTDSASIANFCECGRQKRKTRLPFRS